MVYKVLLVSIFIVGIPLTSIGASAGDSTEHALAERVAALLRHVERLSFDLKVQAGSFPAEPLSERSLEQIIADGVMWLKTAQEETGDRAGRFRYEYEPYEGVYRSGDNIVRQAGTFYQGGEIARSSVGDPYELEEMLVRSADFFASLSRSGSYNERTFRCVVKDARGTDCKLGATSLVLVGLLDLVEAYPEHEAEYEALIHDYASFILAMRNEGAGFRNRFYLDQELQSSRESSFSNGEAMLALARYYRFNEDPEIKDTLEEMFAYINSDAVSFDAPLYLWAMAALRDMYTLWPREAYLDYAKTYTNWRVAVFQNRKLTNYNMCAYVEGVASAHALLVDHLTEDERIDLEREIDFWLTKTQELQIQQDEQFRVFTEADGTLHIRELAEPKRAHGGFLTARDEPTQRIDYTQHCLNAYLMRALSY